MSNISRRVIVGSFLLFGILLLNKGLDLWSLRTNVDGDGIGVHFLGFEINDRVPEETIPSYAIGFLIFSSIAFIISFALVGMKMKLRNKGS